MAYRKIDPAKRKRPRKPEVYFVLQKGSHYLKIGYTIDIGKRLDALQISSPYVLQCLGTIPDPEGTLEEELHRRFHKYHFRGEWFCMEGKLLEFIKDRFEARNGGSGWVFTEEHGPVITLGNVMDYAPLKREVAHGQAVH